MSGIALDERVHLRHAFGERTRGGGIAQDVLEATRQQRPIDGLGDEVGRSGLEGAADRGGVLVARDHDDGDSCETRLGAQAPADRVAVHSRHVDVQQDDRDFLRQGGVQGRRPLSKTTWLKTGCGRRFSEQQPPEFLVVGDDCEGTRMCG